MLGDKKQFVQTAFLYTKDRSSFPSRVCKLQDVELMEWITNRGAVFDENAWKIACSQGIELMIQWALENGYKLDNKSFRRACMKGILCVLIYGMENGYNIDGKLIEDMLKKRRCRHLIEHLRCNGYI